MPRYSAASIASAAAPPPGLSTAPLGDRKISWSEQQLAVFAAIESTQENLQVRACAGTGKTTLLIGGCEKMPSSVAFCAFNKRIADEIKYRTGHLSHVTGGTLHSFGFGALRKVCSPKVVGTKLGDIQAELRQPFQLQSAARFLASLAKQTGMGIEHPEIPSLTDQSAWERLISHYGVLDSGDEIDPIALIECAAALVHVSNRHWNKTIDFDDMIYIPLLLDLPLQRYGWVLLDEAQDTNPVRRLLAARMLAPTGRLVAVGDPFQAIYGFTGADNDAFDTIGETFHCTQLPLTTTYRCARAITEHAQTWVPDIQAPPSAPEGIVRTISAVDFRKLGVSALGAGDAVLCRYTRPCVAEALRLIRSGIGARVEGRDIGQGLISLTKKWRTVTNLEELSSKLEDYREREVSKALAKHNELAAASVQDRVDTLLCIIDSLDFSKNVWDLQATIQKLFGDTEPGQTPGVVTFSTVHKAKGREWERVYILGRETFMPSRFAKQPWQLDQERNLIYVAITRAKNELIEVDYSEERG